MTEKDIVTTPVKAMKKLIKARRASRDANYFDDPDTLDITRKNNKHLSFGQGPHYCLGASLARLEGQIAISTLIERMPNLHLHVTPEQLRWRGTFVLRGLEALPVSF